MDSSALSGRLQRLMIFLQQDPLNLNLLNDALRLAIETHDLASGQTLLAHAHTHAIADAEFYAQASHLQLMLGNYAAAAESGSRALAGGIRHPAVVFNTAFGHFYSGAYSQTVELLAPLAQSDEANAALLMIYARALHQLEETEKAQAITVKAHAKEPDNTEIQGLLALLQYENDETEAGLRLAQQVLADNPNQLDALIACGSAHFELGNMKAAHNTYTHTVAAHPTCGRAWSGLAEIEFNELDFVNAEPHLLLAVQYMPNHIGTWHLLAWVYILQGDSVKARHALDQSYALDRNFAETHGGLAVVDVMDGHEDKARLGIRRALKLNPQSMAAQYAELLLLQKAGNTEAATQLVDKVLARKVGAGTNTGWQLVEQKLKILQAQQEKKSQS